MVRVCDLQEALSDLLIDVTTSQARTVLHTPTCTYSAKKAISIIEIELIPDCTMH